MEFGILDFFLFHYLDYRLFLETLQHLLFKL